MQLCLDGVLKQSTQYTDLPKGKDKFGERRKDDFHSC